MTYQEQYKHPMWQKKRLEVLTAHNFKCQNCGSVEEELHVHHPLYKHGTMVWEYELEDLRCLCHKCHKESHRVDEEIKKILSITPDRQKKVFLGFMKALHRSRDEKPSCEDELAGFVIGIGHLIATQEVPYA